ncbi:DoxX family protein [Larkinella terrae]|uniref:DoxX family membrane protein n=1 Tax=Larkinella terrae TaxID=2025311 RepID=A0A7K0EEG0_9BACT|nr:DoxX family protein [Larkinella terrae]MRS60207.1 DoxX family membrane protein [Larkinella terrae]
MTTKPNDTWLWLLRVVAAGIMLQTLYFKFTAAPESVYIFSKVGMEPWGRILVGIFELIASVLILFPRTTAYGALIGIGVMTGAVFMHIFRLGIVVQDDSGQLFIYALLVLGSCLTLAYQQRDILSGLHTQKP